MAGDVMDASLSLDHRRADGSATGERAGECASMVGSWVVSAAAAAIAAAAAAAAPPAAWMWPSPINGCGESQRCRPGAGAGVLLLCSPKPKPPASLSSSSSNAKGRRSVSRALMGLHVGKTMSVIS